jgi:dihydroorotate dehydrogenase (NAD+) catalytic subunit
MVNLSVKIGSVTLQNPVMPGSGTLSEEMAKAVDLDEFGAIVAKSIRLDIRDGTPPPRIFEMENSLLMNVGIPSKGPAHFVEHAVSFYSQFKPPFVVSLSGDCIEDYVKLAEALNVDGVDVLEVNLSCPNLNSDGVIFGTDPKASEEVIRRVRRVTNLPVWAKLTANAGDVPGVARAVEAGGADAVIVANALLAMAIDIKTHRPRMGGVTGAVVGAPFKPVIMRMVYHSAKVVRIPIIATGGVERAEDIVEYMIAGASAVQVGTASFKSANAIPRLIDGLHDYCEQNAIENLADLIGTVRE